MEIRDVFDRWMIPVCSKRLTNIKNLKKSTVRHTGKVNQFLRKRTYITAREWALARLCTDFRTSGGAEMTFIGNHLPGTCAIYGGYLHTTGGEPSKKFIQKESQESQCHFFLRCNVRFFYNG